MRTSLWVLLGLSLGVLAAAAGAISLTPRYRAELRWAALSMVTPADRAGVRLQK